MLAPKKVLVDEAGALAFTSTSVELIIDVIVGAVGKTAVKSSKVTPGINKEVSIEILVMRLLPFVVSPVNEV